MHSSLNKDLRHMIENHKIWLELMNQNPRPSLNRRQMKLRANFGGMKLEGYDFYYADLRYALADGTDFSGCKFTNTNLKGMYAPKAMFDYCLMIGSSLREMNGGGARFYKTNLTHADISHACIDGASLEGADLTGIKGHGLHMNGAETNGTCFKGADLRFFSPGKDDDLAVEIMRMAQ